MITVVLVETEGEENIGAISRAMMNMEVSNLALVNPQCDHLSQVAMNYAVHASGILKKARLFSSLEEALRKADLSAAVTRRIGQWRKRDFTLEDFSEYLMFYNNRNVSLVFGREKYGLTNDEIRSCDLICTIPSSESFPSINLSQSVMITLYDIYRTRISQKRKKTVFSNPASRQNHDDMMKSMVSAFEEMDFFKTVPSWRLKNFMNKIMLRANLDVNDCLIIKNLFERIKGKFLQLKKDASGGHNA